MEEKKPVGVEIELAQLADVSGAGWFENNFIFGETAECKRGMKDAFDAAETHRSSGIPRGEAEAHAHQSEYLFWEFDPSCE
jgi:hypothetical protein